MSDQEPQAPTTSEKLFRPEALDKLSSPERVDELLRVVSPHSWLVLSVLGVLIVVAVVWSIVGTIPIYVQAHAALVYPRRIVALQATSSGVLASLDLVPGAAVHSGQVVGLLDQTLMQKELDQQLEALALRQRRRTTSGALDLARQEAEERSLDLQIAVVERQLRESVALADAQAAIDSSIITARRKAIEDEQALMRPIDEHLARVIGGQRAAGNELITEERLVELEERLATSRIQTRERELQLRELESRALQDRQGDLQRRHHILDLETHLAELKAQKVRAAEEVSERHVARDEPIEALEREVAKLERELQSKSRIECPWTGRVYEVQARPGQHIEAGAKVAILEVEDRDAALFALACFEIKDGKRIASGMHAQVSPENVPRDRFGSIVGTVAEVSAFPATAAEVTRALGSEDLARGLLPQHGGILVSAKLDASPSTPSGLQWTTSHGPDMAMTGGTTGTIRVTLERRAPITFILPFLRAQSGVD
jgi:HlyD family secretion protein